MSHFFPDALISTSVECEGELSELEGFVKAMEIEVNSMIFSEKQHSQQKLEGYAEEYREALLSFEELRRVAKAAIIKNEMNSATRRALVADNDRLDQFTNGILQSKSVVAETELIGNVITSDLENQREKLLGAGENVRETKEYTQVARRVLNIMSNRDFTYKLFLFFLSFLLFLIIWMLTYYGFMSKKKLFQ